MAAFLLDCGKLGFARPQLQRQRQRRLTNVRAAAGDDDGAVEVCGDLDMRSMRLSHVRLGFALGRLQCYTIASLLAFSRMWNV